MARRHIVIEFEQGRLCWAVAERSDSGSRLAAAATADCPEGETAATFLKGALESVLQPGETVTLLLPPGLAFVRELKYPFRDPRKIAAATPLDLASRLPVTTAEMTVAADRPRIKNGQASTFVAAIRDEALAQRLGACDEAGLHVARCVSIPFALKAVDESARMMLWIGAERLALGLMAGGSLVDQVDWALTPGEERVGAAFRLANLLERRHGYRALPLQVMGPEGAAEDWSIRCSQEGRGNEPLPALPDGTPVPPSLGPVALAALGMVRDPRSGGPDFRQGRFAQRSAWQPLRRPLLVAAVLLGLSLVIGGATAWLDLTGRKGEVTRLRADVERRFRDLFPEVTTIVDLPQQTEAELRDLRRRAGAGGGSGGQALMLLREVSQRVPSNGGLVVREWLYAPEELRLTGEADSFEAVNAAVDQLSSSPLLREATVAEARADAAGKVTFRLRLVPKDPGDAP